MNADECAIEDRTPESWRRVDLRPVLAGEIVRPLPTVLEIDCVPRRHLLYPAAVNGVHGDSGIGKSIIATCAMAQEMRAGRHVMLIDFEDNELTICSRLLDLIVPPAIIAERLHYHRPVDPMNGDALRYLIGECAGVSLVVFDSVGEAFGVHGINENDDAEVGQFLRAAVRPLADAGPAVLLIDHSTKAKDNVLYPSGSKRKRAAITGASFYISTDNPPVRATGTESTSGRLKVTCAKDRHGNYRQGDHVATVEVVSHPDGAMRLAVWPVMPSDTAASPRIAVASRAAVKAAEQAGEPVSLNGLVERMGDHLKAGRALKIEGVNEALRSGALREFAGQRNARMIEFVPVLGGVDAA